MDLLQMLHKAVPMSSVRNSAIYRFKRMKVRWRLFWRKQPMSTSICIGVRNDATIDVDMEDKADDEHSWNFSNLTVEEAEFLHAELSHAIERAKARRLVLDSRNPKPAQSEANSAPTSPSTS